MNLSRLLRATRLALKSLVLHKLRSGLTMLGIVFGVFSVIAMLAIGEGASNQAQAQVLELGAKNIIIRSIKPPDDSAASGGGTRSRVLRYGLKWTDFDLIDKTIKAKDKAIPVREIHQEAHHLHLTLNVRLVGCTPDYLGVNHLQIARGRFLTDSDQQRRSNVAVIAYDTARELYGIEDPIGQSIRISQTAYRVIGITRERTASAAIGGSLSGQDYNKDVYVPLNTLRSRMRDLVIRVTAGSFSTEEFQLNQITLTFKNIDDVVPTAEVVRESLLLDPDHVKKRDFAIVVPLELLKQAEQLRNIFNIVLGSIAAISLIVGGIGIMNIMLATVTERTREIGIRRALGARQRDIVEQFLTETVVLSASGGIVGVLMGLATPYLFGGVRWVVDHFVLEGVEASSEMGKIFSGIEPVVPYWSLPMAFGFSLMVGIFFGIYPALAAAKLDPIEALRHE
jgi:putative ABC transport system permease protein